MTKPSFAGDCMEAAYRYFIMLWIIHIMLQREWKMVVFWRNDVECLRDRQSCDHRNVPTRELSTFNFVPSVDPTSPKSRVALLSGATSYRFQHPDRRSPTSLPCSIVILAHRSLVRMRHDLPRHP